MTDTNLYTSMNEWFLALPTERQAVLTQDKWMLAEAAFDAGVLGKDRALHILKAKATNTLANNLCPDHRDKQVGKSCLACRIEELEKELAKKNAKIGRLEYTYSHLIGIGDDNIC